jgi:hypothetical protein
VLGIEPGTYTHHVGSLHIYEQHWVLADNLQKTEEYENIPSFTGSSGEEIVTSSQRALQAATAPPADMSRAEEWYATAMRSAVLKNRMKEEF